MALAVGLVEVLENLAAALGWDAEAVIAYGHPDGDEIGHADGHGDPPATWAVLDGVVEQIGEHLFDAQRIDPRRQARRSVHIESVELRARLGRGHRSLDQ